MTLDSPTDRLLTESERRDELVVNLKIEARTTAEVMKCFWLSLPEEMPENLRADMTMMWFVSTFMEASK